MDKEKETLQVTLTNNQKLALENLMMKITIYKQSIEITQRDVRELMRNFGNDYGFSLDDIIDINSEQGIITIKNTEEKK